MPTKKKPSFPTISPKRQLANKLAWNETRPVDEADVFTVGYSGRKLDEFLQLLGGHGIATLVDIRQNSTSLHRSEMSKSNLSLSLQEHGIVYVHAPELGIPTAVRKQALEASSRQVLWDWYDEHVVAKPGQLKTWLKQHATPTALMCMELDPTDCHRHRLALALESVGLATHDL